MDRDPDASGEATRLTLSGLNDAMEVRQHAQHHCDIDGWEGGAYEY